MHGNCLVWFGRYDRFLCSLFWFERESGGGSGGDDVVGGLPPFRFYNTRKHRCGEKDEVSITKERSCPVIPGTPNNQFEKIGCLLKQPIWTHEK